MEEALDGGGRPFVTTREQWFKASTLLVRGWLPWSAIQSVAYCRLIFSERRGGARSLERGRLKSRICKRICLWYGNPCWCPCHPSTRSLAHRSHIRPSSAALLTKMCRVCGCKMCVKRVHDVPHIISRMIEVLGLDMVGPKTSCACILMLNGRR